MFSLDANSFSVFYIFELSAWKIKNLKMKFIFDYKTFYNYLNVHISHHYRQWQFEMLFIYVLWESGDKIQNTKT